MEPDAETDLRMDNYLSLTGRLTRDPELRFTKSGIPVCGMRLAHNTRKKENEQWVDGDPLFIDVTAWDRLAERCALLAVGSPIRVTGKLEPDSWTGEDGVKRERIKIRASAIDLHLAPVKDLESGPGFVAVKWGGGSEHAGPSRTPSGGFARPQPAQDSEDYWQEEAF